MGLRLFWAWDVRRSMGVGIASAVLDLGARVEASASRRTVNNSARR